MKNLKNTSAMFKKSMLSTLGLLLTCLAIAQPPGPGDGGGTNPDGVPYDSTLNMKIGRAHV